MRSWGNNGDQQLGDGVTTVAGGSSHNCAVVGSGSVWCWCLNVYGQLGDTTTQRLTPVAVVAL